MLKVLGRLQEVDVVLLWANSRFLCTAGIPIIAAAHFRNRPVVVKIFGGLLTERIRALPARRRRLVIHTLEKVDVIFPQTEGMVGGLAEGLGLPPERVVCLPNFIAGADPPGEVTGDARFGGRCVFVGQVKREKGVFDILDAFAGLPNMTCDLYGPVLERDRKDFLERIEAVENVRYRDVARPEEVRGLIGGYDCLLLPTYHPGEGYPAVVLEAFASGVPVVATRWKSLSDLVADGERGILVPVRSPGAIREALARLRRDGELYRAISRNAARYAASFSERAIIRDILLERVRALADRTGKR